MTHRILVVGGYGLVGGWTVRLAALFDRADPTGPMTTDDSGAFFDRALLRRDGRWEHVWKRRYEVVGCEPAEMASPPNIVAACRPFTWFSVT